MDTKHKIKKYREYQYTKSALLLDIVELYKLPQNARKTIKSLDVWVSSNQDGGYSKICRVESNITFGTGGKSMEDIKKYFKELKA